MKKTLLKIAAIILIMTTLNSCATFFAGKSACHSRPNKSAGDPTRQIRLVPLVLDICCGGVWVLIDFATGAIYQPCAKNPKKN